MLIKATSWSIWPYS